MDYTTISISEELKKELAILKITEDQQTYEDLIKLLVENYKKTKEDTHEQHNS